MNLVLDIGNSRIKYALFNELQLVEEHTAGDYEAFIHQNKEKIRHCILSSVGKVPASLSSLLKEAKFPVLKLDSDTELPFDNKYETRETLGADRVAAIAGACLLYPSKDVLVIDAGTAMTIDLKTSKEEYLGGTISPGLSMRFRALHEQTDKLPQLQREDTGSLLGRSTREAIINGVQNGLIHEVNGYLEALDNNYPELIVLLTGGDSHFFDNRLKKTIFVVSNLTLLGLNFILQYNAKN